MQVYYTEGIEVDEILRGLSESAETRILECREIDANTLAQKMGIVFVCRKFFQDRDFERKLNTEIQIKTRQKENTFFPRWELEEVIMNLEIVKSEIENWRRKINFKK